MIKYIFSITLICTLTTFISSVNAQNTEDSVLNAYVAPPSQVAKAQLSANKEIQYMIDNYSLEKMAQMAKQLNNAMRRQAMLTGEPLPPKLTEETLSSKEKIGEYLRSQYEYHY